MSDHTEPWVDDVPYWQLDAGAERDEWDLHVRAVEDEERDRLTRDEGERG